VTDCRGRLIQSMMPYWTFDWFRTLYSTLPYSTSNGFKHACNFVSLVDGIITMQSTIEHSSVIQSTLRQQAPTWCSTLLSLTWYKMKHASTTPKMFFLTPDSTPGLNPRRGSSTPDGFEFRENGRASAKPPNCRDASKSLSARKHEREVPQVAIQWVACIRYHGLVYRVICDCVRTSCTCHVTFLKAWQ